MTVLSVPCRLYPVTQMCTDLFEKYKKEFQIVMKDASSFVFPNPAVVRTQGTIDKE
jgi:hypothetical protein